MAKSSFAGHNVAILTRDLRMDDNRVLREAAENLPDENSKVLAIFVFTEKQIHQNEFFNSNCVQIIHESIKDLQKRIPLKVFYGNYPEVLKSLHQELKLANIYMGKDYTPFAELREKEIKKFAQENKIGFECFLNHLLVDPLTVMPPGSNEFYKTGMAYFKRFEATAKVPRPVPIEEISVKRGAKKIKMDPDSFRAIFFDQKKPLKGEINDKKMSTFYSYNDQIHEKGGETRALELISRISDFKDYGKIENREMVNTTGLGSYVKFGNVSARKVYWTFKEKLAKNWEVQIQILWREFYYNLYLFYDIDWTKEYKESYRNFPWSTDEKRLESWLSGQTGFPLVDAGIRQLNATGFIHHRLRLVTCNFLFKAMKVDWRHGEKLYAQKLVDYDPIINNGNWMYNLGFGTVNEYRGFFALNPFIQCEKIDPNCTYVKKWVPELAKVPAKAILNWENSRAMYKDVKYAKPVIDFKEENKKFKAILDALKKAKK